MASVLCTVSIIALDPEADKVIKDLKTSLEVGVEASKRIKEIDEKSSLNEGLDVAEKILASLSIALGSYGAILSTFGNILVLFKEAEPTDRQVMAEQFQNIHMRFDAIQSELGEIGQLIGEIPAKVELHSRIVRIELLIFGFDSVNWSSPTQLSDFSRRCDNTPPDDLLNYLYLNRDDIIKSAARHFDRSHVLRAMKALSIIQLNAFKMYETCQAVKSVGQPEDQRKEALNHQKSRLEGFTKNIETVMNDFHRAERNIYNNFFTEYAKTEIDSFAAEHSNLNNDAFGAKLYNMLTTKYYWRKFAVGAYSDEALGDRDHYLWTKSNFAHFRSREGGRSWFVIMSSEFSDHADENKFRTDVLRCYPSYVRTALFNLLRVDCKVFSEDYYYIVGQGKIQECMDPIGVVGIICVRADMDLKLFGGDDSTFISYPYLGVVNTLVVH